MKEISMKYSIVVTSYNASKTIERALKSAMQQLPPPLEIIVIDDCSIDSTLRLVRETLLPFPNSYIFSNPENKGQSYSRNRGTHLACADIVIFMDDDDESLPKRAELHLKSIEYENTDFSYTSSTKKYSNGFEVMNINSRYNSGANNRDQLLKHFLIGNQLEGMNLFIPSSTLAVKKESFLRIDGFCESMRRLEDVDLACRAIESNLRLSWVPEIGVNRYDSFGLDKCANENYVGERILINRYRKYLTAREYVVEILMAKIRKVYLSRNIIESLFVFPLILVVYVLSPQKLLSSLRRIKSDLKKSVR